MLLYSRRDATATATATAAAAAAGGMIFKCILDHK